MKHGAQVQRSCASTSRCLPRAGSRAMRPLHAQAAVFLRFRPWNAADGLRRSSAAEARRGSEAADAALDTEAGPTWRTGTVQLVKHLATEGSV